MSNLLNLRQIMSETILFVDDEEAVLNSFQRQLKKKFKIETALGSREGLKKVVSNDTYAIIVSDYNMPEMNGIEFLKTVKKESPDSVRIMLTGQADLDTAVNSVNEGHIFRFLTKPCPDATLLKTLQAAMELHNLIIAEKELLEKTLSGSIEVLTEILSLVNPTAFGRSIRLKNIMNYIVSKLGIPFAWQFELAALLSLIGCVTIPPETIIKLDQGLDLEEEEMEMVENHPSIARDLLDKIPRMGAVARMIDAQGRSFSRRTESEDYKGEDLIALCGNLILLSTDYDRLLLQGKEHKIAIKHLAMQPDKYFPEAVEVLDTYKPGIIEKIERSVTVNELQLNMILDEDIFNEAGVLVAVKGQEVSLVMVKRIKSFAQSTGIREPFKVIEKTPQS